MPLRKNDKHIALTLLIRFVDYLCLFALVSAAIAIGLKFFSPMPAPVSHPGATETSPSNPQRTDVVRFDP
ncbi:hypothetical protein [Phormidium sp. CCY1219]|uniref:hypothetical protein n=1 Tax=Phormidium sp. CCY1219 TaxID=2886104 RepID=UPI002D1F9358|nr:hypothetical protein [Phormidium sp. CCY1219]MEB3831093.1 hypothetical protein [Phormidium sp. CCY1219]